MGYYSLSIITYLVQEGSHVINNVVDHDPDRLVRIVLGYLGQRIRFCSSFRHFDAALIN